MFFLNLTAAEFFALFGALGGLVTALYLLDRAKRRKVVSTLQFWVHAGAAEQSQSRRKMHDPWSLLLQLASLLLLLLAVSRMQWGNRDSRGHDHIVLLDTGSWTAARSTEGTAVETVLDREKEQARSYLAALPGNDRVMLVGVENLASPLVRFSNDRRQLNAALDELATGFSALDVDAALSFAKQAQGWSGGVGGEIVYIGPQLASKDPAAVDARNLRVIPVPADRENSGIVQLGVQQVENEAHTWKAFVRIRNYGERARTLRLEIRYGGTAFAPRTLAVAAGAEITAQYTFTTRTAGELVAAISPGGSLKSDDRASVFLPRSELPRLAVYTDRPQFLKPLLTADGQLSTTMLATAQYPAKSPADIVILDRFAPAAMPALPSLWIDPPKDRSPISVKSTVSDSVMTWGGGSALESALHAKPLRLPATNTFQTQEGDEAIASVPQGPVVLVRNANESHPRIAALGFDPAAGQLRYEVATPLLFADLLQWLDPVAFRTLTLSTEQVGVVNVTLDGAERHDSLQVTDDHGNAVAFARRQNTLQLFSGRPTTIRIASHDRERVVSLRLPSVGDRRWNAPADAANGLPEAARFTPAAADLWKWLAWAGGAGLLLEWLLFGRAARLLKRRKARPQLVRPQPGAARDRAGDLVSK